MTSVKPLERRPVKHTGNVTVRKPTRCLWRYGCRGKTSQKVNQATVTRLVSYDRFPIHGLYPCRLDIWSVVGYSRDQSLEMGSLRGASSTVNWVGRSRNTFKQKFWMSLYQSTSLSSLTSSLFYIILQEFSCHDVSRYLRDNTRYTLGVAFVKVENSVWYCIICDSGTLPENT